MLDTLAPTTPLKPKKSHSHSVKRDNCHLRVSVTSQGLGIRSPNTALNPHELGAALRSFSLLLVTQLRNEKTKATGNLNNFLWKQLDQNADSDLPLIFAWEKFPGAPPLAGWARDPDQLPRMEVGGHHEALLGTGPKSRTTVLTGSGRSLLPSGSPPVASDFCRAQGTLPGETHTGTHCHASQPTRAFHPHLGAGPARASEIPSDTAGGAADKHSRCSWGLY